MASFDFQGALASGASPQAITNFLSSQGMGNLATTYFNQQPAAPSGLQGAVDALKGFAKSATSPFVEAAGSGIRALQATPEIAKAVYQVITDPQLRQQVMANPESLLAKP